MHNSRELRCNATHFQGVIIRAGARSRVVRDPEGPLFRGSTGNRPIPVFGQDAGGPAANGKAVSGLVAARGGRREPVPCPARCGERKRWAASLMRSERCGKPHDWFYQDLTLRNMDLNPILGLERMPSTRRIASLQRLRFVKRDRRSVQREREGFPAAGGGSRKP